MTAQWFRAIAGSLWLLPAAPARVAAGWADDEPAPRLLTQQLVATPTSRLDRAQLSPEALVLREPAQLGLVPVVEELVDRGAEELELVVRVEQVGELVRVLQALRAAVLPSPFELARERLSGKGLPEPPLERSRVDLGPLRLQRLLELAEVERQLDAAVLELLLDEARPGRKAHP